jgi:hypothetical protein
MKSSPKPSMLFSPYFVIQTGAHSLIKNQSSSSEMGINCAEWRHLIQWMPIQLSGFLPPALDFSTAQRPSVLLELNRIYSKLNLEAFASLEMTKEKRNV